MSNPLFFKPRIEPLEDRLVLSVTTAPNLTPPQTAYQSLVEASVVGENIFYNDSSFDGNDPSANAADDGAIATDKTALLPGQTATFANYTSYSRGINGIMVDIAGLPGNVTASDFVFMVGNNDDPSTWSELNVEPTVTVRWGAGGAGIGRVELTWANNTIQNEWLQVTVLADGDTGLSANDVFYYGNAIGDTGNSTTDAQVNTADELGVQANGTTAAPITDVYDFNRDGLVNTQDSQIAASNLTTAANALNLISVPAATATTQYAAEQPDFMEATGPFDFFISPVIVEANDGTLISVAQGQYTGEPQTAEALVEMTSTNGGQTWSPISIIATDPNYPVSYLTIGSVVVDHTTGAIFLLYTVNNQDIDPQPTTVVNEVFVMSSTNDGKTWSTPQDITSSVMNPGWGFLNIGPGNGIQLTIGPDAGRLVVSIEYRFGDNDNDGNDPPYEAVIYSDDNGSTWQIGGGPNPKLAQNAGALEGSIVQLPNGEIYMNSRLKYANISGATRGYSFSDDGGITWSNIQYTDQLPVPSVGGSLIQLDPNTLIFAAPQDDNNTGLRREMTIWASFDEGQTWTQERVINYDFASFSSMVALGHDTGMLEFIAGQVPNSYDGDSTYEKIELVKFNLAGLESPQTPQFTWDFNDEPIGQAATIGGSSIRDDGPWDERGTVQSSGGIPYYVPGSNGDEALRIVNGSNVLLSPATTDGLQFGAGQSFTFQFVLRTTAANGVLLGEMPGDPGYTFSLVNGAITFNVDDGTNSVTLTGGTIDDGAWHTVVGVRNAATQTLSLYVDGSLVATAPDTTGDLENGDDVTLGSYADGSSQLTLDIDLLQATRAALTPSQFLTSSYVPPQPLPAPTTAANNVSNLPGVAFYLLPYDDRHYFADIDQSDPLLIQPAAGTAARSAIDGTGQYNVKGYTAGTVEYETNPTVGSYWSSQVETGWVVANSNGTQSPTQNFDFVQNTETFTISDVFNVPSVPTSGNLVLVGNNNGTSALPGFELAVNSSGNLDFNITDGTGLGTSLVDQDLATYSSGNSSLPHLSTAGWYQIVIVGSGPGTPLQYYLTPMSATEVQQYQTSESMKPIATPTATGSTQNLQIANVIDGFTPGVPTVNFNDLAIFNQALSPAEVEDLFLDDANPPAVTPSGTINTFTVGGAAVALDSGLAVSSGDTDLTGATVTISAGTLQSGDVLNFTNQNGISGSYSLGVLTLSGSATPAQYQAALQSVTFSTTSAATDRTISVVVSDGPLESEPAAEQIDVSTALPVLTASGTTGTVTVGGAAVAVDPGLAGSPNFAPLTGATVTISSGTLQSGDILSFTSPTGSGIGGSYAAGVLTLTGSATVAQYVAALQSVTFSATSANTTSRAISIVASDGSLESVAVHEQVKLIIAPPVLTPSGTSGTYTFGAAGVAVDPGLTVLSYDTDLTAATLTISSGTLQSGDVLSFTNQNGISGSYSLGVLTLSGSATVAQYQAALQSVTFSTTTTSTSPTTRAISIVALDNTLVSNTAAESINVGNDFMTPSGSSASYTPGASAVHVDPGVRAASSDADLSGATLTISAGTLQSGDTLNFVNQNGISGSYSAGVLTLGGSATPAQYTAALQSVTFSSTSASTVARSISIVALDGVLTSNTAAETVNVFAPVTVAGVYVKGSNWASTYDNYLATGGYGNATNPSLGYALKTGSAQLTTLPWNNINTIEIQFSGPVSGVAQGSLELVGGTGGGATGAAVAAPSVTGFSSLGNNTYAWTLSGPLTNNKYVIAVASTNSSFGPAVTDARGAGISGEFTTGSSTFSNDGNGRAGGTFDFFFNVLPGDANQNGTINSSDSASVKPELNDRTTTAGYNYLVDYNGAGTINSADRVVDAVHLNDRQSSITGPSAPSAGSVGVVSLGTDLALGVIETGSPPTTTLTTTVSSTSTTVASTLGAGSGSTATAAATTATATAKTDRAQHGHHFTLADEAAIDQAILDFDLLEL